MYQISDYYLNHIRIVLDVLNKYNPIGLATFVGSTEYEIEAIDIGGRASAAEGYLATYIQDSFWFWFEATLDIDLCLEMAKEIKERIKR